MLDKIHMFAPLWTPCHNLHSQQPVRQFTHSYAVKSVENNSEQYLIIFPSISSKLHYRHQQETSDTTVLTPRGSIKEKKSYD